MPEISFTLSTSPAVTKVTIPEGGGWLKFDANGQPTVLTSLPEIPAEPDAQDVTDALVTLGLVTQAQA